MPEVVDVWARKAAKAPYPGIVQTDDTCVLVSLAGAVNYLAGLTITELQLLGRWKAESRPQPTFDLARRYLNNELTSYNIGVVRYHDAENPLPTFDIVCNVLSKGGVVIPSVELATAGPSGELRRAARYHMLSVFNLQGDTAQVWDTNNKVGFITIAELSNLLCGSGALIPYDPLGVLIGHDRHEVLVVSRE